MAHFGKMTQGILYILYDLGSPIDYLNELKGSIQSLRKYCDLPITVYTDRDPVEQWWDYDNVNVLKINELKELAPNEQRKDKYNRGYVFLKLYALKDLPYDFTIFVDTDTFFLNDPCKLISEDNDLTICREVRYGRKNKYQLRKDFNTGFFIAKRGENFKSLINKAIEIREEEKIMCDQIAINRAVDYNSDMHIKILPQSWNVRWKRPEKGLINKPNILHWHGVDEKAAKKYSETNV